ncbi:type II secretion system protein [Clostridiaceae bacterium 35-E11]
MIKLLKNEKGLTLIELIVTIAILGTITLPITTVFLNGAKTNQKAREQLTATMLAQKYMEDIKLNNILEEGIDEESEGAYAIIIKKDVVENYQFPVVDEESVEYVMIVEMDKENHVIMNESSSTLSKDLPIEIINETSRIIYKLGEDIEIPIPKNGKNAIVKFEIKGDMNFTVRAYNQVTNEPLSLYFFKTFDATAKYLVLNMGGEVRTHSNYFIVKEDAKEKNMTSRLYKIDIQVKKKDKVLEHIVGYKAIEE